MEIRDSDPRYFITDQSEVLLYRGRGKDSVRAIAIMSNDLIEDPPAFLKALNGMADDLDHKEEQQMMRDVEDHILS